MENNKVYVLEAHFGEHYDGYSSVIGVYSDAFEAEKAKQEVQVKMHINKNAPCPYEDLENLTLGQFDIYSKWYDKKSDAEDFRNAFIIEYEINQTINL